MQERFTSTEEVIKEQTKVLNESPLYIDYNGFYSEPLFRTKVMQLVCEKGVRLIVVYNPQLIG